MKTAVVGSAFALGVAASGNLILTTAEGRLTRDPRVEICDDFCVFEDDDNSWCFETTPPVLRTGWEWNQVYGVTDEFETNQDPVKYWQLEFMPYVEAQVYLASKFHLKKILYFEMSGDLSKFKLSWFFSSIVNSDWYFCPGMGSNNDAVDLALAFEMKMRNCYKQLIKSLCNFADSWSGVNAKYFDKCEDSTPAPVKLHTWTYYEALMNNIKSGTVYPVSDVYCHPLPGIKAKTEGEDDAISLYAKAAYATIGTYFWDKDAAALV